MYNGERVLAHRDLVFATSSRELSKGLLQRMRQKWTAKPSTLSKDQAKRAIANYKALKNSGKPTPDVYTPGNRGIGQVPLFVNPFCDYVSVLGVLFCVSAHQLYVPFLCVSTHRHRNPPVPGIDREGHGRIGFNPLRLARVGRSAPCQPCTGSRDRFQGDNRRHRGPVCKNLLLM